MAIKSHTKINLNNSLGGTENDFFFESIKSNKNPLARSIRYQTKASAAIEIKAPNTAVNPQIKTIK